MENKADQVPGTSTGETKWVRLTPELAVELGRSGKWEGMRVVENDPLELPHPVYGENRKARRAKAAAERRLRRKR